MKKSLIFFPARTSETLYVADLSRSIATQLGNENRVRRACFQTSKFGDESSRKFCLVSSVSSLSYQLLASPLKAMNREEFNKDVP